MVPRVPRPSPLRGSSSPPSPRPGFAELPLRSPVKGFPAAKHPATMRGQDVHLPEAGPTVAAKPHVTGSLSHWDDFLSPLWSGGASPRCQQRDECCPARAQTITSAVAEGAAWWGLLWAHPGLASTETSVKSSSCGACNLLMFSPQCAGPWWGLHSFRPCWRWGALSDTINRRCLSWPWGVWRVLPGGDGSSRLGQLHK